MDKETSVKKVHFKGGLSLNTRSLIDSLAIIHDYENRASENYNENLKLEELSNLIHLLESIIMGNRLYYDGTVPTFISDQIKTTSMEINKEIGASNKNQLQIDGITISSPTKLIKKCKEAMEQSSELILNENFSKLIKTKSESPIKNPDKVKTFFSYLESYNPSLIERDQLVNNIAASKSFQGSKCIIGLLTSRNTSKNLLHHVCEVVKKHTDSSARSYIMAALINRFRINYINSLSSDKQSAYLADSRIESIQNYQVLLLTKYLTKKVAQSSKISYKNLPESLSSSFQKLPIGYAFILNSEAKNPYDLIIEAIEKRSQMSLRYESSQTKFRYLHELNEEDLGHLEEKIFRKYYDQFLNEKKPFESVLSKFRHNIIPPVLGQATKGGLRALASLIPGMEQDPVVGHVADITGEIAQEISSKISPTANAQAYVTNINYWKNQYIDTIASKNLNQKLDARIYEIFNKNLSPSH